MNHHNSLDDDASNNTTYRALVVDSGPIIRQTGLTALRHRAQEYYTVPAVLQEIRDAKARQHLQQLPFDIKTREASPDGIQAVIDFSRQTGDYQSLSAVDIQILGLLYDLEREGCENMEHVRRTPKRKVGVGKVESLGKPKENSATEADKAGGEVNNDKVKDNTTFFEGGDANLLEGDYDEDYDDDEDEDEESHQEPPSSGPKSWAMLVNPAAAKKVAPVVTPKSSDLAEQALSVPFGQMKLSTDSTSGQFSDADDDDDFDPMPQPEQESDDEGYANSDADISDEECDVYILDPEEVEERKRHVEESVPSLDEELESDFPSLAASLNVPYEGDSDNEGDDQATINVALLAKQQAEEKRLEALKMVSNSGKRYNSFRKYGDLLKPKEEKSLSVDAPVEEEPEADADSVTAASEDEAPRDNHSRIIGGSGMSGQGMEVEDDGEGWITSTKDIKKMKAVGRLNLNTAPGDVDSSNPKMAYTNGPPISERTACATTDFAMQNVILQMNLELLSVDGMKVRRLKSWVSRCGACYTVYSNNDASSGTNASSNGPYHAKRLFCSRCGSDMMQRVACSVDSKTGRLRLHLSKKYKTNIRGTKFSLPKAGTNNRFQGDLLLREDQLLMGAWNQKVKKLSGGKSRSSATSMFGSDLASNVGCYANLVHQDDIKVGFGRRNPNASKGGRERRGKKKKSGDKACGLRRY